MVQTPVLFETFVRSDYARRVWDAIKMAQPRVLYFYSNKGRENVNGEIERNEEIRSWVKEIDWDCDLHTWFRDECVNQYVSLKGAMDWVFNNEERAIVLEDDCVPSLAFFNFCDQMLDKFKENKRIWLISGDNYIEDYNPNQTDYIYSNDFQIYGWASWSDRWHSVNWDEKFEDFHKYRVFETVYPSKNLVRFQYNRLFSERELIQRTGCWDFVFMYTALANGGLCVIPARNLVENIGISGTHNKVPKKEMFNAPVTIKFEDYKITREPKYIMADFLYDQMSYKLHWASTQNAMSRIRIFLNERFPNLYGELKRIKNSRKKQS